jgi:hypothetical protein
MNTTQFLTALRKLCLTPASQQTAALLGVSVRHCQRLAEGAPIQPATAMLLRLYLKHGLPASKSD